jgi:hypothetical protein
MSHFSRLPEFEKELTRLSGKYPSLSEDLEKLERLISISPVGVGTNFVTIHHAPHVRIVKTRLACRSLRKRSMRVIYAYHQSAVTFVYIELYYKGDKENEDKNRIANYLKSL